MQARDRLLGTWELIEAKLLSDGIATDYEFSPERNGGGILIYGADGYMCATMSKQERARFSTDQVDGGTDEEKSKLTQLTFRTLAVLKSTKIKCQ
jgi:hypothetical protein